MKREIVQSGNITEILLYYSNICTALINLWFHQLLLLGAAWEKIFRTSIRFPASCTCTQIQNQLCRIVYFEVHTVISKYFLRFYMLLPWASLLNLIMWLTFRVWVSSFMNVMAVMRRKQAEVFISIWSRAWRFVGYCCSPEASITAT